MSGSVSDTSDYGAAQDRFNRELGISLHNRLIEGDVIASSELAEAFLPLLVRGLERAFPLVDGHSRETSAEDALLSYLKRPEQFDANKLSLSSYLLMSAKRDLLNMLEARKIDQNTQTLADLVELSTSVSEQGLDKDEQELVAPPDRTETTDPYFWDQVRALVPDPIQQRVVVLMMHHVRDTEAYAAVLGITHLNQKEQEEVVKRVKDRLKKRLQRRLDLPEYRDE